MCDLGVARIQSQHQYHFWRMSSMFEAYCQASELGSCQSEFVSFMRLWMTQKSKSLLKDCFVNVNIEAWPHSTTFKLLFSAGEFLALENAPTPHPLNLRSMCIFLQRRKWERSGSVVECLTRDRRAAGSSLTGVTALWSLSKTHLS